MHGRGVHGDDKVTDDDAPPPRRDSMSLLRDLFGAATDDEYRDAAQRRRAMSEQPSAERQAPTRATLLARRPLAVLGVGVIVIGMLFVTTALQVRRTAPAIAAERQSLVERIESERTRTADLRAEVEGAARDLAVVQDAALQATEEGERIGADLETLQRIGGAVPLRGPGLVIEVDDAAPSDQPLDDDATSAEGAIQDIDLQQLVNGLWQAGAEAVAVDGNRVTALSSIRAAGDALFMDLHPLTPPYEVVAIGDSQTLGPRFLDSYGAGWFQFLASAYAVGFDVSSADEVNVPAVSTIDLDWAETFVPTDT